MPTISLFMKLFVEPLSRRLANSIKDDGRVAGAFAKAGYPLTEDSKQIVSKRVVLAIETTVLLTVLKLRKEDDSKNEMKNLSDLTERTLNAVDAKTTAIIEKLNGTTEFIEAKSKQTIESIEAEIKRNEIKVVEDIREIIVKEMPEILRNVLNEKCKNEEK